MSDFTFFLGDKPIDKVTLMRDLGILFDQKLLFDQHIQLCCNRALRRLGFIGRNSKDFQSLACLKVLYVSLVRPLLESCCLVWSPYYQVYIDRLERVQRKFLRFICYKFNLGYFNKDTYIYDYCGLERFLDIVPLSIRRKNFDIVFAYKVIRGFVDCVEILDRFDFYVPPKSVRNKKVFQPQRRRTLYGENNCINRIMRNVNNVDIDLFNVSLDVLKRRLDRE